MTTGTLDRGPIKHSLKIHPIYFSEVRADKKHAEIRLDDGRDFRVGDLLVLKEFKQRSKSFTGQIEERVVTGITRLGHVIQDLEGSQWVVLHMQRPGR